MIDAKELHELIRQNHEMCRYFHDKRNGCNDCPFTAANMSCDLNDCETPEVVENYLNIMQAYYAKQSRLQLMKKLFPQGPDIATNVCCKALGLEPQSKGPCKCTCAECWNKPLTQEQKEFYKWDKE